MHKRLAYTFAAVGLTVIVVGCFAVQLYEQQNFDYTIGHSGLEVNSFQGLNAITINQFILLGATPSLTVQTTAPSQSYLANATRSQIFCYVNQNPGVQFRGVAAALFLPVGLAEYHLGVLVKAGLLSFSRDGRYKRFFVSKQYSIREVALICLLRRKTTKRIFETLLRKKELSHCRLAEEVDVTSQALTWQMKTLKAYKYVLHVSSETKTFYSLNPAHTENLTRCLAAVEQ